MLNHVTLLGRLANTPEPRSTTSGTSVTSFDLAVNVPTKKENVPADFIPIVCWDKKADFACAHLEKGRQVVVEGRISTRKYTDKDGNNRKAVEVIASNIYFADSNRTGETAQSAPEFPADYTDVTDDDLPF